MATEKYFQFPMCVLAYGADFQARLNHIIGFCCVNVGKIIGGSLSSELRLCKAEEVSQMGDDVIEYNEENKFHIAALLGAAQINVKIKCINAIENDFKSIFRHKSKFEECHGRDVEVRVAAHIMWDIINKSGISYREFSVLCAIYSCIGNKKTPVRITREHIQCRQLGYKSIAIMKKELPMRTDGAKPLTLRQINYTVDKLHERGFFSRARPNARQTYYSNKITKEDMKRYLINKKTYSARFHQHRRESDRFLMQCIKEAKLKK
jgi:hypothetical protein